MSTEVRNENMTQNSQSNNKNIVEHSNNESRDSTPGFDDASSLSASSCTSLASGAPIASTSIGGVSSSITAPQRFDSQALIASIANFDGLAMSNILKTNPNASKELLSETKHTCLHELCFQYASYDVFDRPRAANIHFRDIFNTLLLHGADVNEIDNKQRSCLHYICAARGTSDIIKFILSIEGANINAVDRNGQSVLHIAVNQSSCADISTLLQHRIDTELLDMHGHSALHVACKKKRNHEVINLLAEYCDINSQQRSQNHRGITPLHAAVNIMDLCNVEALISHRVRVEVKDSSGQTPLHLAAGSDMTGKIVACLMACDANINSQDELFRDTPLHKACKNNMINSICHLVNNDASIKVKNSDGQTPIHIAAAVCQDHVVWSHLLRQTFNFSSFNIPDNKNKTPLDISEIRHNTIARIYIKLYE